jgi:hypothetical protein
MKNKETIYVVLPCRSDEETGHSPLYWFDTEEEADQWIFNMKNLKPLLDEWAENWNKERTYQEYTLGKKMLNSSDYKLYVERLSGAKLQLTRDEWNRLMENSSKVAVKVNEVMEEWEKQNPRPEYYDGSFYVEELSKFKKV